jgi:predicted nucleic acid-binding protein
MSVGRFIDTNLWVYAHLENPDEPRAELAWQFITQLADPVISPQVIAEYYSVMLRHRVDDERIQRNIQRMLQQCRLQDLDGGVLRRALAIRKRYGFSIWDCQILAAALEADCSLLYTEDLQDGQIIDALRVVNPLLS